MSEALIGEGFFFLLLLSGLVPFRRKGKFRIDKYMLIYCRLVLVFLFCAQFLTIFYWKFIVVKSVIFYLAIILNTLGYGMSCFFCMWFINRDFRELNRILNNIVDCWDRSAAGSSKPSKSSALVVFLKINYLFLEGYLVVVVLGPILGLRNMDMTYQFSVIAAFILNHTILACDYLFIVINVNVYLLFRNLNNSLFESCRNQFKPMGSGYENTSSKDLAALRYFYGEYSVILTLLNDINACFSKINLISLSYSSWTIIITIAYLVRSLGGKNLEYDSTVVEDTYFLFFFLNKSVCCILTVSRQQEEAKRTISMLHGLIVQVDDPKTIDEIQILSLLLLHRNVDFDACGFFNLDFTLFLSMISSITTYSIILIQLDSSADNPRNCTMSYKEIA